MAWMTEIREALSFLALRCSQNCQTYLCSVSILDTQYGGIAARVGGCTSGSNHLE